MNPNHAAVEFIGPNGAFYQGYVIDLTDKGVILSVDNLWKPDGIMLMPFNEVYLPLKTPSPWTMRLHEEVEVLFRSSENDPAGWYHATVRMCKGEFAVTHVKVSDTETRSEILPNDYVRAFTPNRSPIVSTTFKKLTVPLALDILELFKPEILQEFQTRTGSEMVRIDKDSKSLVIISRSESTIKMAKALSDMFCRKLKDDFLRIQHDIVERFAVPEDLLGHTIGGGGSNIQAAMRMPGIRSIKRDEGTSNVFVIHGDSREAVKKARTSLEFCEGVVQVPLELIGECIGKGGQNIQKIIDKTGVVRVTVEGENDKDPRFRVDGCYAFIFVGLVECVTCARMLMEYHMAHLREMKPLREEARELGRLLRERGIGNSTIGAWGMRSVHSSTENLLDGARHLRNGNGEVEPKNEAPVRVSVGNGQRGRGRGAGPKKSFHGREPDSEQEKRMNGTGTILSDVEEQSPLTNGEAKAQNGGAVVRGEERQRGGRGRGGMSRGNHSAAPHGKTNGCAH